MQSHSLPEGTEHAVPIQEPAALEPGHSEAFERTCRLLRKGSPNGRERAARELRGYGALAVEPLAEALRDRDPQVRIAAARSLGRVGDGRAVGPLTDALRNSFVGRSARWQVVTAMAAAAGIAAVAVGIIAGAVWGFIPFFFFWLFHAFFGDALVGLKRRRRAHSQLCHALIDALERIAAREPTPELLTVLPDLRAVALDVVRQEKQTRDASREAAARIEALTHSLKDLPLPAAGAAADTASLPRAAAAPDPEVESLPRVVEQPEQPQSITRGGGTV